MVMMAVPMARNGGRMVRRIVLLVLLGAVAAGSAGCDKCGNFLGYPSGQPRSCK
jgi:hypothetical protein